MWHARFADGFQDGQLDSKFVGREAIIGEVEGMEGSSCLGHPLGHIGQTTRPFGPRMEPSRCSLSFLQQLQRSQSMTFDE